MVGLTELAALQTALLATLILLQHFPELTGRARNERKSEFICPGSAPGPLSVRHGRPFDVMGDLAQNDGEEGHQTRHWLVLVATEVAHALSLPTARDPRARGAGG